jgi:peptidoglycan L-alanyl-D-glutamate endopeptidase CwlK
MKDKISEKRIATLHPAIAGEVLLLMNDIEAELPENCMIRVTYGLRTFKEQDGLYAIGRTVPGKIVTNAKGGQSNHNYGFAFDYVLIYDGKVSWVVNKDWIRVGEHFEKHGYVWGHRWKFKDSPHIEKTFGHNWKTLLQKYKAKEFIPNTQYVRL